RPTTRNSSPGRKNGDESARSTPGFRRVGKLGDRQTMRAATLLVVLATLVAACADRPLDLPETPASTTSAADLSATPPDLAAPPHRALPAAPRLIAPLSTAIVTTRRPTLRWQWPAGHGTPVVDFCADRACTAGLGSATVDSAGTSARPDGDLATGPI